jgi:predicted TIM-barrel fold metal-dependent hydrolase
LRPIDAHVHIGRWLTPDFSGRESSLADAVALYSRWNWAGALLFPTDEGDTRALADAVAEVRGPLTFRVGFWADPAAEGNLRTLRALLPHLAAHKVHTSFTRTRVNDPAMTPYLEEAGRAGLPVVVHCGRWKEVAGFEHALSAATAFPEVRFILSHMGGDSPALVSAALDHIASARLSNVFLGTESIREPWLLERAVDRLGANRLVFGSDYNLNHPEPFRRLIEVLDITDSQRTDILRNNINGLLPPAQRFF